MNKQHGVGDEREAKPVIGEVRDRRSDGAAAGGPAPCPWCGKQPSRTVSGRGSSSERLLVFCETAGCVMEGRWFSVERWNSRSGAAEVRAAGGADALLREALEELESDEVKIEGEWGMGRSLKELERDDDLRPIVLKLRAALGAT